MKPRESLARLRRFQIEETQRRVTQIEAMIAEFSKMARELDREIALEEQKSGVVDIAHFAYSTYARAARTRRDNLQRSAEELSHQLEEARQFLDETLAVAGQKLADDGERFSEDASPAPAGPQTALRRAQM